MLHGSLFGQCVRHSEINETFHPEVPDVCGVHEFLPSSVKISCTRMQDEREDRLKYIEDKQLADLFKRLMKSLLIHRPANPIEFMLEALKKDDIKDEFPVPSVQAFIVDD